MRVPEDWKVPPTAEELALWRSRRPWWRDWLACGAGVLLGLAVVLVLAVLAEAA